MPPLCLCRCCMEVFLHLFIVIFDTLRRLCKQPEMKLPLALPRCTDDDVTSHTEGTPLCKNSKLAGCWGAMPGDWLTRTTESDGSEVRHRMMQTGERNEEERQNEITAVPIFQQKSSMSHPHPSVNEWSRFSLHCSPCSPSVWSEMWYVLNQWADSYCMENIAVVKIVFLQVNRW